LTRRRPGKSRKPGDAVRGPPRRWLAPVAFIAFAACAYSFYYLDSLPQAETIDTNREATVRSGDQLRLHGMAPGEALHLVVGRAATMRISFGGGATLLPDPGRGPAQRSGASGLHFRLINVAPESSWLSFRLTPGATAARSTLILEPSRPDRTYLEIRLRSDDAPMTVDMGIGGPHGHIQFDGAAMQAASLTVPPGTSVTLGIGTANPDALNAEAGEVTGAEIGSAAGGDFERRWMVCGGARGRIIWQRPIPRIVAADCEAGRLSVASLAVAEEGIEVVAEGTGFTVKDGATHVWQTFRKLRDNAVLQTLLGLLLVGLAGRVMLVIRRRLAA
jgi:hypothetical protein